MYATILAGIRHCNSIVQLLGNVKTFDQIFMAINLSNTLTGTHETDVFYSLKEYLVMIEIV